MSINRDTIVDYSAVADERATEDGRRAPARRPRSYVALAAALIGVELVFLVAALIVQAATGTPT